MCDSQLTSSGRVIDQFCPWYSITIVSVHCAYVMIMPTKSDSSYIRKPQLAVGERVVWLGPRRQDNAEYATVRWVGCLPNQVSEILAEFDNPIGGGTGRFRGRIVFKAPLNHASFVPLFGLIRGEDFIPKSEYFVGGKTPVGLL